MQMISDPAATDLRDSETSPSAILVGHTDILPSMILTYRYRLLPTRQQHAALARILEDQRQLYNAALQERIDAYQRSLLQVERGLRGKPQTITYFDQTNSLTRCRQDEMIGADMSGVPAFLQHWTLHRLDDAYKAFFKRAKAGKGAAGFPRFRGREYWRSFGFSQNGGFRLGGARCKIGFAGLPGYDPRKLTAAGNIPGGVRIHLHRPLPGDIAALGSRSGALRSITLTRDAGGRKWWISIACEVDAARRCQSRTAAVGIDLGVTVAIAQSDGVMVPGPRPGRKTRGAERRAARALARARRGSKRRIKAKRRLAAVKAKAAAVRRDFAHKQAARLTRCYAVIGVEDLAVANMTRSAKGTADAPGRNVAAKSGLNREILDCAPAALREKTAYKAVRDGARLIPVNPRHTSQACSACGAIDAASRVSQARYVCTSCGHTENADINAAKNIRARALKALALTSSAEQSAGVGLPLGRGVAQAANGGVGRRRPGNTDGASRPDGGGSSPVSIHPRAEMPREPQARATIPEDPRASDINDLPLFATLARDVCDATLSGSRDRPKKARRINGLLGRGRLSRGGAD